MDNGPMVERFAWVPDLARAEWLRPMEAKPFASLLSIVPDGFERYARRSIRWSATARAIPTRGKTLTRKPSSPVCATSQHPLKQNLPPGHKPRNRLARSCTPRRSMPGWSGASGNCEPHNRDPRNLLGRRRPRPAPDRTSPQTLAQSGSQDLNSFNRRITSQPALITEGPSQPEGAPRASKGPRGNPHR